MSEKIEFREVYKNHEKLNIFVTSNDKIVLKESGYWRFNFSLGFSYIKWTLEEIFLPQGFPESVHPDYIPYQIWDTIQAFASTILGTLTTHSILQGVGVGESTATPLAAAISWILKDGTGMIGRIMFAWWKGSDLDAQSKKWRLVADVLNDLAMGIELTLPHFSQSSVTILLCISTSMKSIVGVAGGATRAALTQHQALTNNLADVSAKDGSQETFVNLIASLMGIFILSMFGNLYTREMYLILVAIHIYANYSAIKALRLNTLNEERLVLLLRDYMATGMISDTEKINNEESLSFFNNSTKILCGFSIKSGVSMSCILKNQNTDFIKYVKGIIQRNQDQVYLIIPDVHRRIIYIVLRDRVIPIGILDAYFKAFFYGVMISACLKNQKDRLRKIKIGQIDLCSLYDTLMDDNVLNKQGSVEYNEYVLPWKTLIYMEKFTVEKFKLWFELLRRSEWNYERYLLPVDYWRGNWSVKY